MHLGKASLLAASLAFLGGFSAMGSGNPFYVVIDNQTGIPDEAVYLNIQGASSLTAGVGSSATALNGGQYYSLNELQGSLPGGVDQSGITTQTAPMLNISNMNGGFMNFSLGQKSVGVDSVVNGRFEAFVGTNSASGQADSFYNTNFDISYVNTFSLPMSMSVRNRNDNSLRSLTDQLNEVTTGSGAWTSVQNSTTLPAGVIVPTGGYQVEDTTGTVLGTMSGDATVLGAQGANVSLYPGWSDLLNSLTSNGDTRGVKSYTVPGSDTVLPGAEWTFSTVVPGGAAHSPFSSTEDPDDRFMEGQGYDMTATFTTSMNPGDSDTELSNLGITSTTNGVIIEGTGGTGADGGVGTFTVYITNSDLESSDGIYGSNPTYTVKWQGMDSSGNQNGTTYYVQQQNSNNLVDRVVGDLTAAITFGWADPSTTQTVAQIATAAGKTSELNGSEFASGGSLANKTISELSTSEFFYLLSVLGVNGIDTDVSGDNIAAFSGSAINTEPDYYDAYGDALVGFTDAYTYPYSDRLQGYSPDIFPVPATGSASDADDLFIYLTLQEGGFTYTAVPEPLSAGLIFGLGAVLVCGLRRRRG